MLGQYSVHSIVIARLVYKYFTYSYLYYVDYSMIKWWCTVLVMSCSIIIYLYNYTNIIYTAYTCFSHVIL